MDLSRSTSNCYSLWGLLILAWFSSTCALGQADPIPADAQIPPASTHYMGREIAQTMHYTGAPWLIREVRDREEDTRTLMKALDFKPGQAVCDMGCGNGFYTLKIAKIVGNEGMVYAVDIQPEMLDFLAERAQIESVTHFIPILGGLTDPRLPPNAMDVVLMVDVYHEFSHPEQMLAGIRKSLKQDGRIALVEFRAEDPEVPIRPEHKMSKEQILREYTANGFKLVDEFDDLPWQHLMFFEKDTQWNPVSPE